jgi:hypothetical protein
MKTEKNETVKKSILCSDEMISIRGGLGDEGTVLPPPGKNKG